MKLLTMLNGLGADKKKNRAVALLGVITFLVYVRIIGNGFIESYDDELYITLNPMVSQGVKLSTIKWAFTTLDSGNWHPVTWLSHLLDVSLFGLKPSGHHAMSLLIHGMNVVLLYVVSIRLFGESVKSFMIAAIFAVHPLHVESVAWVADRTDLLCAFWGFATLLAYLYYVDKPDVMKYIIVVALFVLSLLSKPMLVTMPALMLLLDYWPLGRFERESFIKLAVEKLPLLFPIIIITVITISAEKSAGGFKGLDGDSMAIRLSNALHSYMVYIEKMFFPFNLASFYPYIKPSAVRVLFSSAMFFSINVAVWILRKDKKWLVTGWLWLVISLLPVIGIMRVGSQGYADRYMYLPMIGVIIVILFGVEKLMYKWNCTYYLKIMLYISLILYFSIITFRQTGYWQNSFSLFSREVAVTENNWHAHFGIANEYAKRQEFDKAIAHYSEALKIKPELLDARNNLGGVLRQSGRYQEALPYFIQTIESNPRYINAYFNLALTLVDIGNVDAARQNLRQALMIDPSFQQGRELLDYLEGR